MCPRHLQMSRFDGTVGSTAASSTTSKRLSALHHVEVRRRRACAWQFRRTRPSFRDCFAFGHLRTCISFCFVAFASRVGVVSLRPFVPREAWKTRRKRHDTCTCVRGRWRSRQPRRSNHLTLQTSDDACGGEMRRTSCATFVFVVRSSVDAGGFGVRLVRRVRTNANAWRVDAMLFASSSHETTGVDVACVCSFVRRRVVPSAPRLHTCARKTHRRADARMHLLLLPPRVRSHPLCDVASSCLCFARRHASRRRRRRRLVVRIHVTPSL